LIAAGGGNGGKGKVQRVGIVKGRLQVGVYPAPSNGAMGRKREEMKGREEVEMNSNSKDKDSQHEGGNPRILKKRE